jgi:zinc protease
MFKKTYIAILILSLITISFGRISSAASSPFIDPDKLSYHPLKFSPPKVQRVVLQNGIILYILEDHEIPLINVSVIIGTGSIYDPIGKEGLAELTGEVMRTGGTISLSGAAVDEALEFSACSLEISVNREMGSANLSVLKKDMDFGFKMLSDIMQHPVFEDEKLKLAKALKTEELRRIADDPQKLAFREFNRLMYRNNARGRLASISSIENISRHDLLQFHGNFFHPANIMMAVTGDITRDDAVNKVNQYFGNWSTPEQKKSLIPAPEEQTGAICFLSKNIPQSIIIHGNIAPAKKDDDAYAFEVLDFILGSGGFRSRIFNEIRSKRGLAYSAGSFYKARTDYGIFDAYAITSTDSTASVLSLIRSILEDAKKSPFKENELVWAKNSIANSFIFSFLSAAQIAGQQMMLEYEKLPDDYLITFRDKIEKVQSLDIKNVAQRYLDPDTAVILILGNENIYQSLKATFGNVCKMEEIRD